MPSLLDVQRCFAAAVRSHAAPVPSLVLAGELTAAERMSIYRNTARITLTEALRIAFPAVELLVGADFFEMAAARFIRDFPPLSGCLNDYGDAFPQFLAVMPETAALPYLGDVARFEWALAQAACAADAEMVGLHDLAALDLNEQSALRFVPHPSVRLLALQFPADRMADAVLAEDDAALEGLDPSAHPTWLLIHRGTNGVTVERLDQTAHAFLVALLGSRQFETPPGLTPCQIGHAIGEQIIKGRVSAIHLAETPNASTPL